MEYTLLGGPTTNQNVSLSPSLKYQDEYDNDNPQWVGQISIIQI